MEGANVEVDESAEERKGGAGDLGKVGAATVAQSGTVGSSVVGMEHRAVAQLAASSWAEQAGEGSRPMGGSRQPGERLVLLDLRVWVLLV